MVYKSVAIIFFAVVLKFVSTSINEDSKRILLSDPSYVHELETQLQDLTVKYTDVMAKYTELNSKLTLYINAHEQDLVKLRSDIASLVKKGSGGIYIRWGRTTCPDNSTELVYSGFAGGSYYSATGAAAEYICLPSDPQWGINIGPGPGNFVYGAEYQNTFRGTARINDDVPCSVCRTTTRASVLMIPGRTSCYTDWHLEYQGYLAAGHETHAAASEFVCLDTHPQALQHGEANEEGRLFYEVAAKCGSLPCPPYVDNRKMTCVVCSK